MADDMLEPEEDFKALGYFKGTVTKSFWSTVLAESNGERSGPGTDRTKCFWYVTIDDVYQEDFDGDVPTKTVSFSIGQGWEADEDGLTVRHQDDPADDLVEAGKAKAKRFNPNTGLGRILGLASGRHDEYQGKWEVIDGGERPTFDMAEVGRYLRTQGLTDARVSNIWEGLQFTFRGLAFTYRGFDDPVPGVWPVVFHGANTNSPVELALVDPMTVSTLLQKDTNPEAVDKITEALNRATSHTEFVRGALSLVEGDDVNKAILLDKQNGPWSLRISG